MRKLIAGLFAFVLLMGATNAQTPQDLIKKATKAVKGIGDKKDQKVTDAEKAVEDMMKAPENATSWEANLVKAKYYNALSAIDNSERILAGLKQQVYKPVFPESAIMAFDAIKIALKNAPAGDKKAAKELNSALNDVQNNVGQYANDYTNNKEYDKAYKSFKASLDVHDVVKANGGKSNLDKPEDYGNQAYYTGLLATYSNQEKDALPVYEKLIEIKRDSSFVYTSLYKVKSETDPAAAYEYLQKGRKKYPNETSILFAAINHLLKEGKLESLIAELKEAIVQEPKNPSLYLTLGNVYDNLSQKEGIEAAKQKEYEAEAQVYYKKTLEIDPRNSDAIYSIGAALYNKAAAYSKELKKLESDFSKEGQKKYEAAEKNMLKAFDEALPYFEKAEALNPNDRNTLIALKEIFAKKNDLKMSNEFKTRLETIEGGGKIDKAYFKL